MSSAESSAENAVVAPFVVLLVADDLMFPSRVREGVKPLGGTVRVVSTVEAAVAGAVAGPSPRAVFVSLTARRFDPLAVVAALKGDARTRSLPLLTFAGHMETEKHEAARKAGADVSAANSSVALHLPKLLERLDRLAADPAALENTDVLEIEEETDNH
jgi:PleD family two-component response regulator